MHLIAGMATGSDNVIEKNLSISRKFLNEALFPKKYRSLLEFYDLVDKIYCFLTKRNMKCSEENVSRIYLSLYQFSALSSEQLWPSFSMEHWTTVCSFCPADFFINEYQLQHDIFDNLRPNDRSLVCVREIQFKRFLGIGKGNVEKRRKLLTDAMSATVYATYQQSCLLSDSNKKSIHEVNTTGWPSAFDVEQCMFPNEITQTPIANQPLLVDETAERSKAVEQKILTDGFTEACAGELTYALAALREMPFYKGQISSVTYYPPREVKYKELEVPLPSLLQERVINVVGVARFYSHQAAAIDAIRRRGQKHAIISTSTASGKSLIFNLPVLESMLSDPSSTALYLFPTKALAQDQLRSLVRLIGDSGKIPAVPVICDGDSSQAERAEVQHGIGNIILTNPDMLHYTLLPEHKAWKRLFERLRFVVIDEAHQYSGSFGTHVACVLRRLVRICMAVGGSVPQFICCTATIANPTEHMFKLIPLSAMGCHESELAVIGHEMDGSPHGERAFVVWNPYRLHERCDSSASSSKPAVQEKLDEEELTAAEALLTMMPIDEDEEQDVKQVSETSNTQEKVSKAKANFNNYTASNLSGKQRISSIVETATLLSSLVSMQMRTIAFCRTRKLVELVYKYATRYLDRDGNKELIPRLSSYRGGYTEVERRSIEQDLFSNRLLGVAATCALELGIDVGNLQISMHMGFPGTYSSLWQQAGRAGRSGQSSLSFIICFECPIDQYFARYPHRLFEAQCEPAVLDVDNLLVLRSHLACAAKEVPLNFDFRYQTAGGVDAGVKDDSIWGKNYSTAVDILLEQCQIRTLSNSKQTSKAQSLLTLWSDGSYTKNEAARKVSLRMIDPITIEIIDDSKHGGEVIDSMEYSRAFFALHEGAIFMHRGKQFLVHHLNLSSARAHTLPVNVKYITSAQNTTEINISKIVESESNIVHYGTVQVVQKVFGYVKMWIRNGQIFEHGECSLPPLEYETTAVWFDLPMRIKAELEAEDICPVASMHAANHLLVSIGPLRGHCDACDLGTEHDVSQEAHGHLFRMMLYDKRPGGLGSCANLFTIHKEMLRCALDVVSTCSCALGCPSCILDSRCTGYNRNLNKLGALKLLQAMSEAITCQPCVSSSTPPLNTTVDITNHDVTPYDKGLLSGKKKEGANMFEEFSPKKRQRQLNLKKATLHDSERSRNMSIQSKWTELAPDFITDSA